MGTYEFDDELGHHIHKQYSGAYDPRMKITCPVCLDRLAQQRLQLCEKYGWKQWPLPIEE